MRWMDNCFSHKPISFIQYHLPEQTINCIINDGTSPQQRMMDIFFQQMGDIVFFVGKEIFPYRGRYCIFGIAPVKVIQDISQTVSYRKYIVNGPIYTSSHTKDR